MVQVEPRQPWAEARQFWILEEEWWFRRMRFGQKWLLNTIDGYRKNILYFLTVDYWSGESSWKLFRVDSKHKSFVISSQSLNTIQLRIVIWMVVWGEGVACSVLVFSSQLNVNKSEYHDRFNADAVFHFWSKIHHKSQNGVPKHQKNSTHITF